MGSKTMSDYDIEFVAERLADMIGWDFLEYEDVETIAGIIREASAGNESIAADVRDCAIDVAAMKLAAWAIHYIADAKRRSN